MAASYEVVSVKKHLNDSNAVRAFTVRVKVTIGSDIEEEEGVISDPVLVAEALAESKKLNEFAETLSARAQKRLEARLGRITKVDPATVTIDPVKVEEKKASASIDSATTK
jgi:hypothetical protein